MDKKELRKQIACRKKEFSMDERKRMSQDVLSHLENHPKFKSANRILMYYSLGDEVFTHDFVERWCKDKQILLPVVVGDDLILRCYEGIASMVEGAYKILEPSGEDFTAFDSIDLAVVPGVAFDKEHHRLGRGKGYYDRLLPKLHCPKIGLCFPFQMVEQVPTESFDIPMDDVVD